jgi:hypothetical protein
MAKKKPRVGRPPRHEGVRLSKNRTFRIRDDLDGTLETAARLSGRSVSEEIEYRLDRSFLGPGNLTPSKHEDAVRLVNLAMAEGYGRYWTEPPVIFRDPKMAHADREFETNRQIEAENVRTALNIIIAAVAKLPAQPRPAAEWPLDGAERAYDLLEAIHVHWPRDLSFLADQIEEAKRNRVDAARAERAEQDARDAKKKRAPPKEPEKK